MKVIIFYQNGDVQDSHSNHKDILVPRVGDRIFMGYTPPAEVLGVVLDYEKEIVSVLTDGLKAK